MKKTLISLTLATLVLGTSNLMASDTTTLTKATVKLIKNYHNLNVEIDNINNFSESNLNKINDNNTNIEKLTQRVSKNETSISKIKQLDSERDSKIKRLFEETAQVKETAKKASDTAFKTQKLVNEMRGISNSFKKESNSVVNSATTAYQKSVKLEEKVSLLEKSLELTTNKLKSVESKLNKKSSDLAKLNKDYESFKVASEKKNEELDSKIKSLEIYYKAELRILKAKFDRARPVYVIDKETSVDCSNGKCNKTTGSSDEVIKNFLK